MLFTWKTAFKPTFSPGGIEDTVENLSTRLFDNFENYASDAALQAAWTVALVGGGASADLATRTTAANALHGQQAMQLIPAAGSAQLRRAINNNFFHFPAGGRIRYVVFKATASTVNTDIRARLSNTAGLNDAAGIYREWTFTLGNDVTRDHIIDIYSGGAGYQNGEGFPGPSGTIGTWDPLVINNFSFRNLANGITYRFDDIRFYYEYSTLEAIGFGTEIATDDGADGSVHSKLRYLNNIVLQLIGSTSQYNKYGPAEVRLNNSYTWGLELKGMAEQGIPSTTEITPGNYTIDRVRLGTTTNIVASTAATEAAGFISATYTPLEDNWQLGDEIVVTFSAGRVDSDTDTAVTPTANIGLGATTIALANAALFQAGQRIRIYDDLTTEWNAVISVDSPTQITVTATANAYTAANNFRVVLAERNDLQTARFAGNVTHEPEITAELERWVLADYDDFDFADADGNNERWDTGYIANTDGSAAGTEGGTADINTSVAGQARVRVDPDATPTRAAYAIKRDETFRSRFYSVMVDADVTLNSVQATATYAGLRISAGDADDPTNYIIITREASSTFNRISTHAEFNNIAQADVNFSTTDNAVAFKIERYGNVWNLFYSLTQYPNWIWTKLTQYEDVNGDMSSITSAYLYAESVGTVDAQVATGDFDNFKYYIGSGSIDQLLSVVVLATGTFTTSSATVPADTGRTEADNFWNGTLIIPTTGAVAFQPRTIVSFANAGGVFTIDPEATFTAAPAVGDEYAIIAYQYPLEPGTDATSNSSSAHVVGSKADTAQYSGTSTNSSIVRLLRAVHRGEILASGTLTTDSATVPADTGRTEVNNYWNGSWLMTVAGAVAFQPRLITGFANAGGVFTLDAQQSFTGVPGLSAYVILAPNSQLVPAVDATSNATPAHVIGNKTETIPAMTAAPVEGGATTSLVALVKAIMERVGATPADPDDSVLTNIGQRDDAATLDTLGDVTTTSIQAKLRRLLLRFSADAFSSTVQGVARTDVENMVQGLANYLSAAGAAWSVTANPGGAARDNLEQTLEDFADVLAGATGITTFPVRAVAANGVSIAEVLRHAAEAVGEDSADNAFASTLVVANRDGSALERLEFIFSILGATSSTTTALGTTTTFIDTARTEANDYWNGRVYFVQTSGANVGLAARVVDFDAATDTGTLEPALPNAVASGVTYVLIAMPNNYELGDDNANNAYTSTNVAENGDGSIIERLEEIRGRSPASSTFTLTAAMGTAEQTISDLSPIRHGRIAVELDLNTLVAAVEGGTVIVRLKNMIDGATLRTIDRASFIIGTDEAHPTVSGWVQEGTTTARVTIQANSAVSVNRDIPWRIVESS